MSSTAFLRAASTGGEHAVHAVCRVRYSCVRACLAARGLAWDTNRVQRRQRSRRRARPPSSLRRCCERSLPAHAECTWQSSAVQAFRMGPSVGTEGDPCTVLNAHAGSVTCDPGIWREASRAVCSYFRKSKPVHCEMPIWRCNASVVLLATRPHRQRISQVPCTWAPYAWYELTTWRRRGEFGSLAYSTFGGER